MDDMDLSSLFRKRPLSLVIDEFLFARRAERYSPDTIRSYDSILSKFSDFVGPEVDFGSLDSGDIRHFLGDQDELADKTICNYHIALSSLWTWAVANGYAKDQIVRKVRTPKYVKKRIPPFSEEEIHKILHSCRYARDRAIVMILLDTGMRASELANLNIEDWQDRNIKVVGKGKKVRVVPISEPTEKAIYRYLRKRKIRPEGIDGGPALLANVAGGDRMCYLTVRDVMRRLERYSGVPDLHAHRFRHTFAINYLRNEGDIYTLQQILGHSTLTMVKNYLDIVRSDLSETHAKSSPVVRWHLGAYCD